MNKMTMPKSKLLLSVALVFAGFAGVTSANAGMVVDRGLPTTTANLNNAAGANQSNIRWADNESTTTPSTFYLPGDDFTIAGSGAYNVSDIRVWSTDATGLSLLGGLAGGSMAALS